MSYIDPSIPAGERVARALRAQGRIVGALMLRDMRTRFGRSHLSFLIALAWPLSHLLSLFLPFVYFSKFVPLGGSASVYIATGIAPYILCMYPARMVSMAIVVNHPLLMFPIVKTTDIILARIAVEILGALIVISIFVFLLAAFEVEIVPPDPAVAVAAVFASILFGVSLGVLNVVVVSIFKFWQFVFLAVMIVMWVTAGATTVQVNYSEQTRYLLSFNPLMHLVVWMRSAYYGDFSAIPLSKSYVMAVAVGGLFLGFGGDRLLRGRVLLQP
jgi:capsular polysaccharide transport system permease protein